MTSVQMLLQKDKPYHVALSVMCSPGADNYHL